MGGTPSTSTKLLSQLQWRVLTVLGILAGWLLWSLTMTDISKNSMMTTSVGRSMSSKVGSISQEDNQADAVSQEPFLLTSKTATANMTTATVTLTPTAVDSQPTLDSPNGVPWMICNANGFINSMPVINVYDLDGTWSCPMKLCKPCSVKATCLSWWAAMLQKSCWKPWPSMIIFTLLETPSCNSNSLPSPVCWI